MQHFSFGKKEDNINWINHRVLILVVRTVIQNHVIQYFKYFFFWKARVVVVISEQVYLLP